MTQSGRLDLGKCFVTLLFVDLILQHSSAGSAVNVTKAVFPTCVSAERKWLLYSNAYSSGLLQINAV